MAGPKSSSSMGGVLTTSSSFSFGIPNTSLGGLLALEAVLAVDASSSGTTAAAAEEEENERRLVLDGSATDLLAAAQPAAVVAACGASALLWLLPRSLVLLVWLCRPQTTSRELLLRSACCRGPAAAAAAAEEALPASAVDRREVVAASLHSILFCGLLHYTILGCCGTSPPGLSSCCTAACAVQRAGLRDTHNAAASVPFSEPPLHPSPPPKRNFFIPTLLLFFCVCSCVMFRLVCPDFFV